jgi:ATP-dependent helicase HrpA
MTPDFPEIQDWLQQVYAADRFRLLRLWRRISRLPEADSRKASDRARWYALVEQSMERRRAREAITVSLEYDPDLPISTHRDELIRLIRERQALVICGETGSGKSTQLPKLCLEAGFGRRAMIGHTQPRRLAARSIASRLRAELGESASGQPVVGFKIRFTDATLPTTLVKLMTDGMLLAELARDRFLDAYEVIILDEAHERSLNIDLLMAHLHRLLGKRPELRLLITSATIDAERFADFFQDSSGPAPIVHVSGRTYPVELRYLGNQSLPGSDDDRLRQAVGTLLQETRGDILAFFPTEREIRLAHRLLQGSLLELYPRESVELLPLYSRLTEAEQQRIFQPHRRRRIILATNVAESSLTVPNIHSVIDTGTARISRYAPRSKVQRLPIEAISQASANQRAGRCGRLGPGICIRLYDESDFASRPAYTTPEIRRTDLASAILHAEMLRLGKLEDLAFLDPPRPEMIRDGLATLHEIGALDADGKLTDVGRRLGHWPVGPRIGRMLIEAQANDCLAEVLIIASALEAQDVRLRPPEKQAEADQRHQKFADLFSDFTSILKVWDFYHRLKAELGRSRLERACRENFLSLPRLFEWQELYRQLRDLVQEAGWKVNERKLLTITEAEIETGPRGAYPEGYAAVHQSVLSGLLSGVAYLDDSQKYKGAGGLELQLWPGSHLRGKKPRWIMSAEIVETQGRYARTAAAIEPEWVEKLAPHLLKKHHDEAFFSRKQGSAMTYERATLYGLPVVVRRPVPLAPIDPEQARRLLIDEGLVARQLVSRAVFYQRNNTLLDEVQAWASRTRNRDLVVDPFFLQQFYNQHLPADVVDRGTLERYDRQLQAGEVKSPAILLNWQQLAETFDRDSARNSFPESLVVGPTELSLEYRFAPGAEDDGVTVKVPAAVVGSLSEDRLGWLVPGLLEEKVIQLIKSLPKELRRNLVPAPAMAAKAMPALMEMYRQQRAFWPSLCTVLSKLGEVRLEPKDFELNRLDPYLNLRLAITDDAGQVQKVTRNVASVRPTPSPTDLLPKKLVSRGQQPDWVAKAWTQFEVDTIPQRWVVTHDAVRVERYVALVDRGNQVEVEFYDEPLPAAAMMQLGVMRLFAMANHRELRSQVQHLPGAAQAQLQLHACIPGNTWRDSMADLICRLAFVEPSNLGVDTSPVWTRQAFEDRQRERVRRLSMAAAEVGGWLPRFAKSYHELKLGLPRAAKGWEANLADVERQLAGLTPPNFLWYTPWEWLREYPRYLEAIRHRIGRWQGGGIAVDTQAMAKLHQYEEFFFKELRRTTRYGLATSISGTGGQLWPLGPLAKLRWMIEEYRVSLFAQQLGTRESVSPKRLDKLVEACQA